MSLNVDKSRMQQKVTNATKSHECNKKSRWQQKVTNATKSHECKKKSHECNKKSRMQQKVTNATKSHECNTPAASTRSFGTSRKYPRFEATFCSDNPRILRTGHFDVLGLELCSERLLWRSHVTHMRMSHVTLRNGSYTTLTCFTISTPDQSSSVC